MKYIQPSPNPSGAYPAPQDKPFRGSIALTENQAAYLVERNGFVTITETPDPEDEGSSVTLTENTAAWEAWKAAEAAQAAETPAPTQLDRVEAQAAYTAMMTNTMLPEV